MTLDLSRGDVLLGRADRLDADALSALAAHPLSCLGTEYPHAARSVDGSGVVAPSERHPVFFGCFDWHSSVHSHWSLCRQVRLADDHPEASAIRESIASRLTPANVERECEQFERTPGFERPYGWGWLLRLAAELHRWDDPQADRWRGCLDPLEQQIREAVRTDLLDRDRPQRVGTHGNTAFALACVLDYARTTGRGDLATATTETARLLFLGDTDYPLAYEPLGWDFVSPALVEATLLCRVLDAGAFVDWFELFLPGVANGGALPDPVEVSPDADGLELHYVGLNLSRAWCLATLADALDDRPYAPALRDSAWHHARQGLDRAFTGDYAGAHWLSSFVLFLLTRSENGIAPGVAGR